MKIDKIDSKIISELLKDGRMPANELARKTRCSREVLSYRLNRLTKLGIIKGFITNIDIERLGFVGAAIFIATKRNRDKEFQEFIKNNEDICWVGEQIGIWNYGFSLYAKSISELDKKFLEIYEKFKNIIVNYRMTLHKKNTYLYDKFFLSAHTEIKAAQNNDLPIDQKDKKLLSLISLDARATCTDLATNLNLTSAAIGQRLRKLEKKGAITQYSVFVDFSKLDLFQYSIFIDHKNLEQKDKLLTYLTNHKSVCFVCEYSGEPFLEFGLFVDNPYKLKEIFQELAENFPEFKILEISLQKEIVSFGPPKCVFS